MKNYTTKWCWENYITTNSNTQNSMKYFAIVDHVTTVDQDLVRNGQKKGFIGKSTFDLSFNSKLPTQFKFTIIFIKISISW